MKPSNHDKKQQEYGHIINQYKTYKLHYHARPLILKQVSTYLEFTQFITQLIPTFASHYYGHLTHAENSKLIELTLNLFDDILSKLKNIGNRMQNLQAQKLKQNSYDKMDICRICLHGLRQAQVQNSKSLLNKNEILLQTIMKAIKQVQNEKDLFDKDQDINFFRQLRLSLQKKNQVIQICRSESLQFTNLIEDEIKELLNMRQSIFLQNELNNEIKISKKGAQLKQDVSKSYNQTFKQKLPGIVKKIEERLQKNRQRQQRHLRVNVEVQTSNMQSTKISQLKRKIASLQAQVGNLKTQKNNFQWQVEQKQSLVQKLNKQLLSSKQQINDSHINYQRQIKTLQQNNLKLRQQLQKLRQKRDIEFRDRTANYDKTNATFKMSQTYHAIDNIEQNKGQDIKREESREKKRKKKDGTLQLIKSNHKIILPTIKKIGTETSLINDKLSLLHSLSLTNQQKEQQLEHEPQVCNEADMSTFQNLNLEKTQSKKIIRSSTKKKTKDANEIMKKPVKGQKNHKKKIVQNNANILKANQKNYQNVKTQRSIDKKGEFGRLTHKQSLPKIMNNNQQRKTFYQNKASNLKRNGEGQIQKKRLNPGQRQKQKQILLQTVGQINKIMRSKIQNKLQRSGSLSSEKEDNAHLRNKSKHKSSIFKNVVQQHQDNQNYDDDYYQDDFSQRQKQFATLKIKEKKSYLVNSFKKIKQQIDMQSYVTPQIAIQTTKDVLESKPKLIHQIKGELKQILDRLMEKEQQVNEGQEQQLNNMFINCMKLLKAKGKLSQFQHNSSRHFDDKLESNQVKTLQSQQKKKSINMQLKKNLKLNMNIKGLLHEKKEDYRVTLDSKNRNESLQQKSKACSSDGKKSFKEDTYQQKQAYPFVNARSDIKKQEYMNIISYSKPNRQFNNIKSDIKGYRIYQKIDNNEHKLQNKIQEIRQNKQFTNNNNLDISNITIYQNKLTKIIAKNKRQSQKYHQDALIYEKQDKQNNDSSCKNQKSQGKDRRSQYNNNTQMTIKNYKPEGSLKKSNQNSTKNSRDHKVNIKPNDYITEYAENQELKGKFKSIIKIKNEMKNIKKNLQNHLQQQKKRSFNLNISQMMPTIDMSAITQGQSPRHHIYNPVKTQSQQSSLAKLENTLFISQQIAYNYEMHFIKTKSKKKNLQPQFLQYAKELFEKLQKIKTINPQLYMNLCSYFRYPYSNSQSKLLHLDIIKNISYPDFIQCLQQILPFHRKCKFDKNQCGHLIKFKKILNDFIKSSEIG